MFMTIVTLLFYLSLCLYFLYHAPWTRFVAGVAAGILALAVLLQLL